MQATRQRAHYSQVTIRLKDRRTKLEKINSSKPLQIPRIEVNQTQSAHYKNLITQNIQVGPLSEVPLIDRRNFKNYHSVGKKQFHSIHVNIVTQNSPIKVIVQPKGVRTTAQITPPQRNTNIQPYTIS